MLTVKHIALSGRETIHLAHEVTFIPTDAASNMKTRSPIESAHEGGRLEIVTPYHVPGEPGGHVMGLEGGTVFVMNEVGKTVSRYDLGASNVAFGVDSQTLKAA